MDLKSSEQILQEWLMQTSKTTNFVYSQILGYHRRRIESRSDRTQNNDKTFNLMVEIFKNVGIIFFKIIARFVQ